MRTYKSIPKGIIKAALPRKAKVTMHQSSQGSIFQIGGFFTQKVSGAIAAIKRGKK